MSLKTLFKLGLRLGMMPFIRLRCISEDLSKPESPRFITRRSPGIVYSYNRLAIVRTFDDDDILVDVS